MSRNSFGHFSFNRSATCGHQFLADRILAIRWRSWRRPVVTSLGRNLDMFWSRGTTTPYILSFSRLLAVIEERRQPDLCPLLHTNDFALEASAELLLVIQGFLPPTASYIVVRIRYHSRPGDIQIKDGSSWPIFRDNDSPCSIRVT